MLKKSSSRSNDSDTTEPGPRRQSKAGERRQSTAVSDELREAGVHDHRTPDVLDGRSASIDSTNYPSEAQNSYHRSQSYSGMPDRELAGATSSRQRASISEDGQKSTNMLKGLWKRAVSTIRKRMTDNEQDKLAEESEEHTNQPQTDGSDPVYRLLKWSAVKPREGTTGSGHGCCSASLETNESSATSTSSGGATSLGRSCPCPCHAPEELEGYHHQMRSAFVFRRM